jgi:hypothetical protein
MVGDGGMVSPMGTASPMYGGSMMYGANMASPMPGGNMPPQGFASGGEVGNPAQGIQQFKNGGLIKSIASRVSGMVNPAPAQNPAQNVSGGKAVGTGPTFDQIEQQRIAAERKAAEELAQAREKAFSTPTVLDDKTKQTSVNPNFLNEFARRFDIGNQGRQIQQSATVATPRYLMGGNMPVFASGGVVDIPQAGANYTQGPSYASDPGNSIPQAGAVYTHGVANAGRNGDTMLAHMSQSQADLLKFMGGAGSKNPKTDLPEYYMASAGPLLQGMGQRVSSAAQAMNTFGGRLLNPVLTKPTLEQGRSTLGTFTPRTAEGLELSYPTLTQRIGAATQPVREAISNMPAYQKAGAALTTIPGAAAVSSAFGGGTKSPGMPMRNDGTDVPIVIGRDSAGNQVFDQPPAPPTVEAEKSIVEEAMNPPSTPKSVDDLLEQQKEAPAEKKTLENRLDKYMQENLPVFQKYMGGDKEATQVQALLLLADAGLEYATTGARTGAMALANAAKKLPGGLGQLAAQETARKSQIAGAALTSGLQTIAAEDKAEALLRREILKKAASSGEIIPTDLGAGLTSYRGKQGDDRGVVIDPKVTDSFIQSTYTPQVVKDDRGNVIGLNTPYARVTGTTSQTINTDKGTRERLANEVGRQEAALRSIDTAIKDYTTAFGPSAFITNLKNNTLVPVVPFLNPDVIAEKKRTQILTSFNTAAKAIARTGDTGNIAVAEQTAATALLGDKPGTFFADPETSLARMLTVRTDIANQRLTTAQQLGWINQDIQLEVPNLGTRNDPIPIDKLPYVANLAKENPKGQVYIMTPQGVQQVLLSTLQQ